MAKIEQLLLTEPEDELKFRGPFTDLVTLYMKIINPTRYRIYFKIKTNAPKKYWVRPNSGILEPEETVDVAVTLLPFLYDPNENVNHKFMVQSIKVVEQNVNLEQLWIDAPNDCLMKSKFKCIFEMPNEALATPDSTESMCQGNTSTLEQLSEKSAVLKSKEVKLLREAISEYEHKIVYLEQQLLNVRTEQIYQPQTPSRVRNENMHVTSGSNLITLFIVFAYGVVIGLIWIVIRKYIF